MPRLAGEVGALTKDEQAVYKASPELLNQLKTFIRKYTNKWETMTPSDIKALRGIAETLTVELVKAKTLQLDNSILNLKDLNIPEAEARNRLGVCVKSLILKEKKQQDEEIQSEKEELAELRRLKKKDEGTTTSDEEPTTTTPPPPKKKWKSGVTPAEIKKVKDIMIARRASDAEKKRQPRSAYARIMPNKRSRWRK